MLLLLLAGCGAAHATSVATQTQSLGIDESAIDPTVKPCDDFYQYACGGWLKRTEIPADKAQWSRGFSVIDEDNQKALRAILEDAVKGIGGDKYTTKLGAFYQSCTDEAAIEKSTPAEIKRLWGAVDGVKDMPSLVKELAHQHLGIGGPMFTFGQEQDFKDASLVIGVFDQGGLALPDRDYYVQSTGKFPLLRQQYQRHVAKMLELAGEPTLQAQKDAATVMRIETALARASMSRVDRRDPKKIYHRLELAGIQKAAPRINWKQYLGDMGVPDVTKLNVRAPDFFVALNKELQHTPLADWKTYLRWTSLHGAAPALSNSFVNENFAFFGNTLNGIAEIEPRWKRCARAIDEQMGEALGQAFVRKTFGADGKQRTLDMVKRIEQAMNADLDGLGWFDEPTRKQAHVKLAAIDNKIGYPDKWRNYDALEVTKDSYLVNMERATEFENRRQLAKIGKPVDRDEWEMTPPTVNAYYTPVMNEMFFPAGILQPPFFNRAATAPVNFGAIGMVMGHELTHGFDDEGRQFDAKGNMRDWWSPNISKEFDTRAQCVVDQFSGYVAVDELKVNGKLTLGENIADLGGLKLAHAAYVASRGGPAKTMGRFTDEQLFFLGTAQSWCTRRRPEMARVRVTVDPHAPPQWRVNGPMSNLSEFAAAFACKPGDKMVRPNACLVW